MKHLKHEASSMVAGYSAEEISTPHQFQPYGDIFTIKIDGTGLHRLTHGESSCPETECKLAPAGVIISSLAEDNKSVWTRQHWQIKIN